MDNYSGAAPQESRGEQPKKMRFSFIRMILEALIIALIIFNIYFISPFELVSTSTDSMIPEMPVDSISVAIKIDAETEYQVGDIITFSAEYGGIYYSRITHRIVAINEDGTIQTKGDHNAEEDPFTITKEQIINKVKWTNILRK